MDEHSTPTVDTTLAALSAALRRASDDLRAAVPVIEQARVDIASRNTSIGRTVIVDAKRVVDRLRQADESLRAVVKDLEERD
jgi:ABC-type transporter Mla subunit MlaD